MVVAASAVIPMVVVAEVVVLAEDLAEDLAVAPVLLDKVSSTTAVLVTTAHKVRLWLSVTAQTLTQMGAILITTTILVTV